MILYGISYEFTEQRMRIVRTGLEFGMELYADEEIVFRVLDGFDKRTVRRSPRNFHALLFKCVSEIIVKFKTVTVTLRNAIASVCFQHARTEYVARICSKPHSSAHFRASDR